MELVMIKKFKGQYDLLHPRQDQIQYVFYGLPKEVCDRSFVFDDEYNLDLEIDLDYSYMAVDFAIDLMKICEKHFLWWSGRERLQKVIDYLKDHQKEQEKLMCKKSYDDAVKKKQKLLDELKLVELTIENLGNELLT